MGAGKFFAQDFIQYHRLLLDFLSLRWLSMEQSAIGQRTKHSAGKAGGQIWKSCLTLAVVARATSSTERPFTLAMASATKRT